jgi:endo-1,4-beta-mannosidase
VADTSNKRLKSGDEEIDKKSKVVITDEMFEAARLTKGGVAHIKDLDMSVLDTTKNKDKIGLKVAKINMKANTIENEILEASVPIFDFESEAKFSPDENCQAVATQCWDWLLGPIKFDDFKANIRG